MAVRLRSTSPERGPNVAVAYLDEHQDAEDTKRAVEAEGRLCILIAGDIGDVAFCQSAVQKMIDAFGRLDILVNNAAEQHPKGSITEITKEQLERTYRTNLFAMFYLTKAARPHLLECGAIINTTSLTSYAGSPGLLDYSSTKDTIVAFTRSLSQALVEYGIRVSAAAPGPIWTPLIPSTFDAEKVSKFGSDTPMKRAGQPCEVAPCFVFLASNGSSYISGQVLHPNGGEIVNN